MPKNAANNINMNNDDTPMNNDDIKSLIELNNKMYKELKEQKKMIAPLARRKGRRTNSIRIGRSASRKKKSSSASLRSVEGSLELNLSWPPPSSSSSENEEEGEFEAGGQEGTVGLNAGNEERAGQDELTASQEHTFGLVQKFYGNDKDGDAADTQLLEIEGSDDGLLSEDEEEED